MIPSPAAASPRKAPAEVTPDVFVRRTARRLGGRAQPGDAAAAAGQPPLLSGAEVGPAGQGVARLAQRMPGRARTGWSRRSTSARGPSSRSSSEIVKRQQGFFERGVSAMKPLTLREVAEAIGMHESTVSRVTSNKYLLCDRGLYELKYFFGSGVASAEGEGGAAAEAVKAAIKELIDAETEILSDDAIADLLKATGLRRRPAHRRQISRGDGHRLVDPAPAAAEDRRLGAHPRPDRQMVRSAPRSRRSCARRRPRCSDPCGR